MLSPAAPETMNVPSGEHSEAATYLARTRRAATVSRISVLIALVIALGIVGYFAWQAQAANVAIGPARTAHAAAMAIADTAQAKSDRAESVLRAAGTSLPRSGIPLINGDLLTNGDSSFYDASVANAEKASSALDSAIGDASAAQLAMIVTEVTAGEAVSTAKWVGIGSGAAVLILAAVAFALGMSAAKSKAMVALLSRPRSF